MRIGGPPAEHRSARGGSGQRRMGMLRSVASKGGAGVCLPLCPLGVRRCASLEGRQGVLACAAHLEQRLPAQAAAVHSRVVCAVQPCTSRRRAARRSADGRLCSQQPSSCPHGPPGRGLALDAAASSLQLGAAAFAGMPARPGRRHRLQQGAMTPPSPGSSPEALPAQHPCAAAARTAAAACLA